MTRRFLALAVAVGIAWFFVVGTEPDGILRPAALALGLPSPPLQSPARCSSTCGCLV